MTKIGEMPYLNSEIFYLNRISDFNYINLTPKKMGVAISEMKINAGPISLVDFFKTDNLNLLNNFCVATKKSANSVFLFSEEKVDDIDNIYMEAIQKMGIQGGWPLNIFLMPDQKPFYGGTYFSPNNWMTILDNIKSISVSDRNKIQESSEAFTNEIIHSNKSYETNKIFSVDTLVNEIRMKLAINFFILFHSNAHPLYGTQFFGLS